MKTPRRVHIIDDSKDMQALLRLALEAKGYQVGCSLNGQDAMATFRSCEKMPDVILLDSMMPVMSGTEFLQARKDVPRLKAVPVVIMSGEEERDCNFEKFIDETCSFLKKPFPLSAIMELIEGRCLPMDVY